MPLKRLASWLFTAGIAAASLFVAPSAVADTQQKIDQPTVAVKVMPARSANFGLLSNCPITSRYGHAGAYICETQPLYFTWYNGAGQIIAYDDVVIGTDYRIYDDPGSGWRWLQGGISAVNGGGIYPVSNDTMAVIGTDNFGYCNTTTAPGQWRGWVRCGT